MENFFNKQAEEIITPLAEQYNELKDDYKEIFIQAALSIRKALDDFKPDSPCLTCNVAGCQVKDKDIFTDFPNRCKYKDWQSQAITYLNGDYIQQLKNKFNELLAQKDSISCNKCGACCKLAVSEYSGIQLRQRALKGDKISEDFIKVFKPFESIDDARNANPEYFDLIEDSIEDQKAYYYHCPKLDGNLCSDYENRPEFCKIFPNNPLKLLPSTCSYNQWRKSVLKESLSIKAKLDIIKFYKLKLG
ncbi:YkgJ family cysteine cluster protein [bacterium]|nr:YkgJ family cysteine cluster protein [bacterium]